VEHKSTVPTAEQSKSNGDKAFEAAASDPALTSATNMAIDVSRIAKVEWVDHPLVRESALSPDNHILEHHNILPRAPTTFDSISFASDI
jgi:hypothetical protein